jgi:hypothetical protein
MSDLDQYPEEHPETGKVKNPLTGNWVKQSYARKQDLLDQAKQHTQQHFKEEDGGGESEEIDQLLQEAENVDPGEAFSLEDEELERLDERADINHPEIPDSEFPNEEGFDPAGEDDMPGFEQPPTPEGLEDAARQQQSQGDHKGIYSGKGQAQQQRQADRDETKASLQRKHENQDVRYVRTEQGGMKMVHLDEENNDE